MDLLTAEEREVFNRTAHVWNGFLLLDRAHPDELTEFRHAMHALQRFILARPALRAEHPNSERNAMSTAPTAEECAEPILQFFHFQHLPPHLAAVSGDFCKMAYSIVATLPRNPERTVALRKLLEAKDAAVRAVVFKSPVPPPSK